MRKGFSLIELLVVIAIIAVLATTVIAALAPARRNARDTARKVQLNGMGRFLLSSGACYVPQDGAGDYDLKTLFDQVVVSYPQITQFVKEAPRDPKTGSDAQSGFRYAYDGSHCALYANLESPDAAVDLPTLTAPTPGGGSGILKASAPGPNGSDRYYQIAL